MTTVVTQQLHSPRARLEPMAAYVVAVESDAQTTGTGLVLPETIKKQSIATVLEVGPDVRVLEAGDVIVYKEGASVELMVGRHRYILVREADVLARVRE